MKRSPIAFPIRTWTRVAFCLLLSLLAPRLGTAAEALPAHTLAIIPFYSPEKIWHLYTPFIEYLKAETKLPWELKLYPDHNSLIEELCRGEISISLLGPVPMGRVQAKCAAQPFLVALNKEGAPSYQSVVLSGDPAVTEFDDLRGKKFGFFKGSTAAHIAPLKMLQEAGLENSIQPRFLDSQDRLITALLTKELSGAGVKESLYRKFKSEPLRVLKISPPLPNFAFCASPTLPGEVKTKFAGALRKLQPLTNPADAATTKEWDDEIKNGFIEANAEFIASVLKLHQTYHEVTHED